MLSCCDLCTALFASPGSDRAVGDFLGGMLAGEILHCKGKGGAAGCRTLAFEEIAVAGSAYNRS